MVRLRWLALIWNLVNKPALIEAPHKLSFDSAWGVVCCVASTWFHSAHSKEKLACLGGAGGRGVAFCRENINEALPMNICNLNDTRRNLWWLWLKWTVASTAVVLTWIQASLTPRKFRISLKTWQSFHEYPGIHWSRHNILINYQFLFHLWYFPASVAAPSLVLIKLLPQRSFSTCRIVTFQSFQRTPQTSFALNQSPPNPSLPSPESKLDKFLSLI